MFVTTPADRIGIPLSRLSLSYFCDSLPAAIFDHTLRFGLSPEVGGRDRSLPENHRRADQ